MKARPEIVTIRLSREAKAALQRLAGAENRTLSQYIALVLEEHLKVKGADRKPD